MMIVLIYVGRRREELHGLTPADADLSRRHGGHVLLRIRAKKTSEGGGTGEWVWQPKTTHAPIRATLREDFRHTFSSQHARKGMSPPKAATLMGNSPEICLRRYASHIPDAMRAVVDLQPSDLNAIPFATGLI